MRGFNAAIISTMLLCVCLNVSEAETSKIERKKSTFTRFDPLKSTFDGQTEEKQPTENEEPLERLTANTSRSELHDKDQQRERTEGRLDLPHTAGSLQTLLQRINDRLTTLEALENQQLRKLDNIDYRITRLEVLSQEKSGADKTEHFDRKIENLEWEINKYGTILDVIRQDLDKIQQRQTELKVALSSSTIQSLVSSRGSPADRTEGDDPVLQTVAAADIPAKIQSIANQVQQIRKVADNLQSMVYGIGRNLTDVNNVTRMLHSGSQQTLTKQYFNVALKELQSMRQVPTMAVHTCGKVDEVGEEPRERIVGKDCAEIKQQGHNRSGIYRIKPRGVYEPIFVYCDMESEGGGWTVIQRRVDGTINFYREWLEYKYGFGNVAGEYWLGNENIYHITKTDVYQIKIELEDFDGVKVRAEYSSFALGSEKDGYMIKLLGIYAGDAGDSFSYHASMKFSTRDVDNDHWEDGNCAETHTGGWWYKGCDTANLNGQYFGGDVPESMHYQGVYWYEWHGPEYSLHKTTMKIRPAAFQNETTNNNNR